MFKNVLSLSFWGLFRVQAVSSLNYLLCGTCSLGTKFGQHRPNVQPQLPLRTVPFTWFTVFSQLSKKTRGIKSIWMFEVTCPGSIFDFRSLLECLLWAPRPWVGMTTVRVLWRQHAHTNPGCMLNLNNTHTHTRSQPECIYTASGNTMWTCMPRWTCMRALCAGGARAWGQFGQKKN